MTRPGRPAGRTMALAAGLLAAMAACRDSSGEPSRLVWGGDAARGLALIASVGCGACHVIPGVRGAAGRVGPPLAEFGRRALIAGELPNTPDQLERWLIDPPAIEPATAMPNLGLDAQQARDIAAYLYTLR